MLNIDGPALSYIVSAYCLVKQLRSLLDLSFAIVSFTTTVCVRSIMFLGGQLRLKVDIKLIVLKSACKNKITTQILAIF